MSNFTIKVVRFTSVYPEEDPDSYIIGFNIVCNKNKRSTYKEKRLSYKEIKSYGTNLSDEKIVEIAWEKLQPLCQNWCKESLQKSNLKEMAFQNI